MRDRRVLIVYGVFDHLLATEADTTGGGSYNQIAHYVLDVSPEIPSAGVPRTSLAQPVLDFDGSGNPTQRNLVGPDPAGVDAVIALGAILALNQADTVTWVASDNLGTPRDEGDISGLPVNHSVFATFGLDVYDSNPAVTHWAGFAGGHVDPNTSLVNDYHRWYDPATGRWISDDPLAFDGGDTNLARYGSNDPTTNRDPLGLRIEPSPLALNQA